MKHRILIQFLSGIFIVAASAVWTVSMANQHGAEQPKRLVLVGASIGKEWHFDKLGERMSLPGYRFDYVGVYQFDKGALVRQLLEGKEKPDAVLLKECSTYFPGDVGQYKQQVMSWVLQLRQAGVQPMLVTVAPVAEPTGYVARAKNMIKRVIGKPTWLDSITQYNDWLKEYARSENIPLFDLEAVLHRSADDRWLRADYDVGDSVHLNATAYRALDVAFSGFVGGLKKTQP